MRLLNKNAACRWLVPFFWTKALTSTSLLAKFNAIKREERVGSETWDVTDLLKWRFVMKTLPPPSNVKFPTDIPAQVQHITYVTVAADIVCGNHLL